ncbi:hypothetical protein D3C76_813330 [compost metagenome]
MNFTLKSTCTSSNFGFCTSSRTKGEMRLRRKASTAARVAWSVYGRSGSRAFWPWVQGTVTTVTAPGISSLSAIIVFCALRLSSVVPRHFTRYRRGKASNTSAS